MSKASESQTPLKVDLHSANCDLEAEAERAFLDVRHSDDPAVEPSDG